MTKKHIFFVILEGNEDEGDVGKNTAIIGLEHLCGCYAIQDTAVQRKKFKKSENIMEVGGWGGSRYHSEIFFWENHPKIALNQYRYFGVVYHVYSVCIYIVKSC